MAGAFQHQDSAPLAETGGIAPQLSGGPETFQQQQHQSMLKQDMQNQTRAQQQHLQTQLNNNQQRALQGGNVNSQQQVLPNSNGGMLQRQTTP